jgi:hypothetical protein
VQKKSEDKSEIMIRGKKSMRGGMGKEKAEKKEREEGKRKDDSRKYNALKKEGRGREIKRQRREERTGGKCSVVERGRKKGVEA